MRWHLSVLTAVVMFALGAQAALASAVFQFNVPLQTERGDHQAFLWIPPEAKQVRGVIMAGMTLMEREFVQDQLIRAVCSEQQLALVFMTSGLGSAPAQQVLDDLAAKSGYRELSMAPVFFVGHSAGGGPARARATQMAARCFGLVQFRGGVPGGGDNPVPPGLPTLTMVGQFDEFGGQMRSEEGREGPWEGARDAIARYRAADPANLASILVEPGAGHFAWSERNAQYLALFIRKSAQTMIPESWPIDTDKPIEVTRPDHTTGWLTDLTLNRPGKAAPAPHERYEGDKAYTAWHFDEELAKANVAFHEGMNRKDQFIRWRDRFWVDAGARFFFTNPTWVDDGQTIEVNPDYADVYPSQYGGHGPRWPQAGQPVGNAGTPIKLKIVGGPLVVVGERRLRVQYSGLAPAGSRGRMTFMAYSEGNETYRHTEHVGMMPRGFTGLNRGRDQTITFPPLADVKPDSAPIPLRATSDADLPVEYYIAHGPAIIEDGKVKLAQIPARATYPIEVKVVAYQFGRALDPQVKTADPVEQTFHIRKP